jgi:hypothetical protein
VTAAALAFWQAPVKPVAVSRDGVTGLPFMNRQSNLEDALGHIRFNQVSAVAGSRDRQYRLPFCAQLFGVGKTSFAAKLAEGLNAGFGGRLAYYQ